MNRRTLLGSLVGFLGCLPFASFLKAEQKPKSILDKLAPLKFKWLVPADSFNLCLMCKGYISPIAKIWDWEEIEPEKLERLKSAIEQKVYWHFVAYEIRYDSPNHMFAFDHSMFVH